MGEIVNDNTVFLSIVIPVYNVEKFVIRCLDSIYIQKFQSKFEVIVVDDCSTDNSLSLLYEYKKSHPDLIIIKHEKNLKLSVARKSGILVAKGLYVMHVDSDDFILPNAFEKLYNKIINFNPDVIVYNYLKQNNNQSFLVKLFDQEILTKDKLSIQKYFFGSVWNKVVKRKFFIDMIYGKESINSTEDLVYSTEVLLKVNTILLCHEALYVYSYNSDSITATVDPLSYMSNQLIVYENLNLVLSKYNANLDFKKNLINYLDKWIFLELFKLRLTDKLFERNDLFKLVSTISLTTKMDEQRMKKFIKAFNGDFYCLYEIGKRFNLHLMLSFINKYFQNKFKSLFFYCRIL